VSMPATVGRRPVQRVAPARVAVGEPLTVAVARYRTPAELDEFVGTLASLEANHLTVVFGTAGPAAPAALARRVDRLVVTADRPLPPVAGYEPDPFRAVVGAMTTLRAGDGLVVLVPAGWAGPSPEYLVEQGRRWRAAADAPHDGEFYPI
jgi:hypothetical protein